MKSKFSFIEKVLFWAKIWFFFKLEWIARNIIAQTEKNTNTLIG